MGAAKVVSNGLESSSSSGTGPIGFIVEVSTVPAVMELPTLDALRDEQRSLRAAARALAAAAAPASSSSSSSTDAVIVLAATAAVLVFLDWLFRFGLPVRLVLLTLCSRGCSAFLGVRAYRRWRASRLDELSLAVTLDRYRPGVGQQIADVLQLPGPAGRAGGVDLAGHGPAGRAAGVRGPGRVRLALALEPQADGPARRGLALGLAGPGGLRAGCPAGGSVERRALAAWVRPSAGRSRPI